MSHERACWKTMNSLNRGDFLLSSAALGGVALLPTAAPG
jgi:hypothetical protein